MSVSFCPRPIDADRFLRILEAEQPGLDERVDGNDLRARALGVGQRGEHARVIGGRVVADEEDDLRFLEVVDFHAALAHADGGGKGRAGTLVAHVGAVREIVGAEVPGEDGVKKG